MGGAALARLFSLTAFIFILTGCASIPRVPTPSTSSVDAVRPADVQGVQHRVQKGETLWRIARTYGVSVDDIIRSNAIPNAASIEEGQLVLIPGAAAIRPVILPSEGGEDSDYLWPVKGKVIAYFQDRRGAVLTDGIDIKAVEGEIVRASRDGRVVFADHLAGYGQTLILDHDDGFFTVYGHNAQLMVALGEKVFRGQHVAQVAREGALAYLHFQVRKGDKATNPLHYLP